MRVLVTGLADIARKAYLPMLSALPDLDVHLAMRDPQVPHDAGHTFHVPHLHASIEQALATATFDADFVHTATSADPALVQPLLVRSWLICKSTAIAAFIL